MEEVDRRHFFVHTAAVAGMLSGLGSEALAQSKFPSKPLSLIVPYPAGGASDVSARIFAESISQSLKQQVIVENIGGGTGLIGAARVLNGPADAYMFFHGSANEVFLTPMLNPAARYKPTDFAMAAPITEATIVLMVKKSLPVASLDEFLEYARTHTDKPLSYASVGIDSMYHLMGDALAARLKLSFLHVPYKGAAPALQDVAGGQVDFAILPYQASFEGMQQQGRLKILSSFSKSLPPALHNIPLITASTVIPDFEHTIAGGYFVRRGAPAERVAVLRQAIGEALAKKDIRDKLELEGRNVFAPMQSQQQVDQAFDEQLRRVTQLVKAVGRAANNS